MWKLIVGHINRKLDCANVMSYSGPVSFGKSDLHLLFSGVPAYPSYHNN